MRRGTIVVLWVVLLVALLTVSQAHARPHRSIYVLLSCHGCCLMLLVTEIDKWQKRVSDQRLAELETYMALRKMAGKLVTVPLGFGQVDPAKIGRRRRRSLEVLLQELRNPLTQDDRDNTADANANVNAMLADNSESDEDVRDYVESHQSLPEWYHAAQV
ncbi:uncharacterized protein LOC110832969 isoform X2 [Zootermopsis nevadensis]|nr:uncharacterized protein LOC110832969 isoform X2 [Zootermopsis nevadensis]XP_021926174.1 uncharacterized protein LOC110832969 isoform X2 [Zootermopsis nevadensis]XP_021926175.1 uncharacterized protein LOC110832969 isoform X2 [Zootermopsis nevadensis]XP_021926176.1 uncharacterized protein LOC110832969 isoform X2 [Zootermopsis nevadensis]